MPAGSNTQREHGAAQHHRIEIDHMRPHCRRQSYDGLRDNYGAEPEHEPGKLDLPGCAGSSVAPQAADDQEYWGEQQHAQHLRDDCRIASRLADSTSCRERLGHLVHSCAGVDAELALGKTSQRIEHGIKEHGEGSEHHHRGHGYADLVRFAFDYPIRRQHRRRSTDSAARAHQ